MTFHRGDERILSAFEWRADLVPAPHRELERLTRLHQVRSVAGQLDERASVLRIGTTTSSKRGPSELIA